jgi:phosphatidylglycerol:prolipoprotein diacylglycerol transferase
VHPELVRLHLFGIERPIYSYGVLVTLGMAAGIGVAVARARRFGIERFDELAIGLLAVAGGLVGGVALFVAVHLRLFLADPSLLRQPGLVFYGGLVGGAAAALAYCRAYRVPLARAADAAAPGLALGHAIGRLGCLMGGCCYGRPVAPSFPLAVEVAGALRHPVQLYEAAGLIVLALATLLAPPSVTRRPGLTFALYLAAYAPLRFAVEHWRGDDFERGFVVPGLLSTSQAIAVVVFVAALAAAYRLTRKGVA